MRTSRPCRPHLRRRCAPSRRPTSRPCTRSSRTRSRRSRGTSTSALETWRAKTIAKKGHDPSLWLLLEDEQGLAGAALGERWENGVGYVAELGVAARARGRGYGRILLLGLFDAFRTAGLTHAELSVHGRNRGALRLYESVGMQPTWQAERWEKALGPA